MKIRSIASLLFLAVLVFSAGASSASATVYKKTLKFPGYASKVDGVAVDYGEAWVDQYTAYSYITQKDCPPGMTLANPFSGGIGLMSRYYSNRATLYALGRGINTYNGDPQQEFKQVLDPMISITTLQKPWNFYPFTKAYVAEIYEAPAYIESQGTLTYTTAVSGDAVQTGKDIAEAWVRDGGWVKKTEIRLCVQ